MGRKLLTLDDLATYCRNQKIYNFSAKNNGDELVVQVPAVLNFAEESLVSKELMYCEVRVCHTLLNVNNSYISENNMVKAMPSLKYRPMLAAIHQLDDGTYDFHSHDIDIDEDGNAIYVEKQIGTFTADEPYLEYDKKEDKTYVVARVAIPENYTMAADIIKSKGGKTDVSCELAIEDMSYNAEKDYLELNNFYFLGCTCLGSETDGTKVKPGMKGSHLKIEDFSVENNSLCSDPQGKLIEVLEKLNDTISNFSINTSNEEGGNGTMNKLEELLTQYGLTVEEIDFETEGLSDEELETLFAEKFGKQEESEVVVEETVVEEVVVTESEVEETEEEVIIEEVVEEPKTYCSVDVEKGTVVFELSFEKIQTALYNLININNTDSYSWICEVFDDYFVYQKYKDGNVNYYKQSYSVEGDSVSLSGDSVEVFTEFLTDSERIALAAIRAQYAELKAFKEGIEAEQLKVEKEAILNSVEYVEIKETDDFKALITDMGKYSVEELKVKADLLFASAMKKKFNFVEQKTEKQHSVGTNFNAKPNKKKQAYGGLFEE